MIPFSRHRRSFLYSIFLGAPAILLLAGLLWQVYAQEQKKNPSPLPFVKGSWTLALLPDTQYYSEKYPGLFDAQTAWIARNKEKRNVQYVLQLGDITQNGTAKEWRRARDAMSILDGRIPYAFALGNHDYATPKGGSATTRETLCNQYFSAEDFKKWPTFGGLMKEGELNNCYHLFEAGGRKWIVLSLEWGPRDEVVAWADEVLRKHPQRKAILITHAYLWKDGTRLDWAAKEKAQSGNPHSYETPGTMNDGEQLWTKLVKKHDFAFVFSGHISVDDSPSLSSKNEKGTTTHQILSDFQRRNLGGEAYLTLVEFLPDGKTVQVKNYSPLYDSYLTKPTQQYTLKLD
ncbi:MAG: metallophosphoesterase [Pirellulales bacterium]|nr:metallophosphoesterase [Pirellulales bacterium]